MKRKKYIPASMEIIYFENEDIICTSNKKTNFTITANENLGSVDASYFDQ